MAIDNRERILTLINILEDYINNDKGITMEKVLELLSDECDKLFDRKVIYKDIEAINKFTKLNIAFDRKINAYRITKKSPFSSEEVEIITNALLTARFIPGKITKEIIDKLVKFTGISNKTVSSNLRIEGRIKFQSADVIKNIGKIREAINKNCKIQFSYIKYDTSKVAFVEKRKCVVSPYEDVWYQDFYYMLGNYDGSTISHYRVDRMKNIKLLKESRKNMSEIIGAGREFNVAEYMSKLVGMSSGYEDTVEVRFKNEFIGDVIDTLGDKVSIGKEGKEHFKLRTQLVINKKLVKWILSFGSGAVVLYPDSLKQEIIQDVQKSLDLLKELT